MSDKFIIVKYASELYPQGVAPHVSAACHPDTYTAEQCGVTVNFYSSPEEAEVDLKKMIEYNPTVGYGIVKVL